MDRNELAEWLERMSVVAEEEGFRSAEFHVDKLREIAAALRESEGWRRDAERYRWLRDNANNSLHLSRNEHAGSYMTAEATIEEAAGDKNANWFAHDPPDETQKMKDMDTIWCLQIYPDTPVGFNVWNRSTLDAAIDAARKEGV